MALNNNISYRHLRCHRTAFYAAFLVFFTLIMPLKALASSYTVENIEVDVTADNAVQAREKAFEEAQIKGYQMLAERFLSPEEMETFEAPDINTVSALVKDYEVTNEQLSAVRYKGVYKIRYSDKAFGLGSNGQQMQDDGQLRRGDVLVLPFYESGGRSFLWQVNPFLEAWVRARNSGQAGRAIIPVGDIDDITSISDDQARNYDPSRVNAMRLRYQAKDVALMIATPEDMGDGSTNITVSLYNVRPYGPELARQISVRGYPGEMPEQRYNRVVAEVSQVMNAGWKRETAIQETAAQTRPDYVQQAPLTGPVNGLSAQINFSTVREWVEIKRSIERAYGVKSVQVESMSPRSAKVKVDYQGELDSLRQSLQRVGVGLNNPQTVYTQTGAGQPPIYQLYALQKSAPPTSQHY